MSDLNVSTAVAVSSRLAGLLESSSGVGTGSWVTTKTAGDAFAGGWLVIEEESREGARWAAVIAADPAEVIAAVPVSEMELWAWSVPDGAMPAWIPVLAAAKCEAERAQIATREARAALNQHRDRLEAIVDAAHGWADDNDLCSRFDDFMLEQGLRPRSGEK